MTETNTTFPNHRVNLAGQNDAPGKLPAHQALLLQGNHMLLKAALNGKRTVQEHAQIPLLPAQIAADSEKAVLKGITAIHIHPRDNGGVESLQWPDIEPVIRAIRLRCPTVSIGISTGEWIEPDVNLRLKYISQWQAKLDFGSVNFSEKGAIAIASKLLENGIEVEAGIFHAQAAKTLIDSGLTEKCLRIMFEPRDKTVANAIKTVDEIEKTLSRHNAKGKSRLLHGADSTAWPLLGEAQKRGYDTRIGFEDTLYLPNQQKAATNSELIDAAQTLLAKQV